MGDAPEFPELNALLDRFDENPRPAVELLRGLSKSEPERLRALLLHLLCTREGTGGVRYLSILAVNDDEFLARLCDPDCLPREDAARVLRRLLTCQPKADVRLLEAQRRLAPGEETALRALTILDDASEGSRLLPLVAPLLKAGNSRIRSKAALFIGRRTKSLAVAARALHEASARVRANAIEAISGVDGPEARALLWGAVMDSDNRVSGNALLALYQRADTSTVPLIREMAYHPDASHRRTAAWVIGETGNQRFSGALVDLLRDPAAEVRAGALKAMRRVKDQNANANRGRSLQLTRLEGRAAEGRRIRFVAMDDQGAPLCGAPATAFTVVENQAPRFDYQVEECHHEAPLNIAFLIADEGGAAGVWLEASLATLRRALSRKRPHDRWAMAVLEAGRAESRLLVEELPILFQHKEAHVAASLERPPAPVCAPLAEALALMLPRLVSGVSSPNGGAHVMCLAPAGWNAASTVDELGAAAARGGTAIHVIAVGDGAPAPGWERLARLTSGMVMRARSLDELENAWLTLLAAAVSTYEVSWQGAGPREAGSLRMLLPDGAGVMEFAAGAAPVEAAHEETSEAAPDAESDAPMFRLLS
jgi:hypothetical protein